MLYCANLHVFVSVAEELALDQIVHELSDTFVSLPWASTKLHSLQRGHLAFQELFQAMAQDASKTDNGVTLQSERVVDRLKLGSYLGELVKLMKHDS